jgi:hypothetical protein
MSEFDFGLSAENFQLAEKLVSSAITEHGIIYDPVEAALWRDMFIVTPEELIADPSDIIADSDPRVEEADNKFFTALALMGQSSNIFYREPAEVLKALSGDVRLIIGATGRNKQNPGHANMSVGPRLLDEHIVYKLNYFVARMLEISDLAAISALIAHETSHIFDFDGWLSTLKVPTITEKYHALVSIADSGSGSLETESKAHAYNAQATLHFRGMTGRYPEHQDLFSDLFTYLAFGQNINDSSWVSMIARRHNLKHILL